VVEQALREKVELEARVKYLQSQVGQLLQEKRRNLIGSRSASNQDSDDPEEEESNALGDSDEDVHTRRSRRHHRPHHRSYNDFKVDIRSLKVNLIRISSQIGYKWWKEPLSSRTSPLKES